jgi:small subunit ribosomal protein S5
MSEEQKKEQSVTAKPVQTGADTKTASQPYRGSNQGGARRTFGGKPGFRKGSRFQSERPKPEFEQKIINISRVTRVVKGGRRLSFRVDMIIGDKKGRIGLGSGKATDTSIAIQKAFNVARKALVTLKLTKNSSIPHNTDAKVTASRIEIMPNKERGLVAGSTVRNVLELAGITDVSARVHSRSKNKLNNAKATIEALRSFETISTKRKESIIVDKKSEQEKGRFDRSRGGAGGQGRRPSPSSNR